jgi:predicted alpha/beta hydrolase family esterase
MNDIKGIPYAQVKFDKDGKRHNNPTISNGTTDLIVVSHGWNNNEADAEELYLKLFGNFADQVKNDNAYKNRKVAIVGVIWPSKKFDELMTQLGGTGKASGGAKSLGAANQAEAEKAMLDAIDRAAALFEDPGDDKRIAQLKELVPKLDKDEAAQETFVKTLRGLLDPENKHQDQRHREDSSDVFFEADPKLIFKNATAQVPASASAPSQPAQPAAQSVGRTDPTGKAQGIGAFFSKAANAVTNLLNLSTYFEMKQRAGTVGKNGVGPLINDVASKAERIHLVGHSFGGRVVTAAAANSTTNKLHSMALLQAAFSHNGFSKKRNGFFREVVDKKRVVGPIFVTHTKNDTAVGLAYPAAARISHDVASAFGGPDDKFGGIGSNGAQQMEDKEVFTTTKKLVGVGGAYQWEAGHFHNLESSDFIRNPTGGDAHGFVFVPEVAWAISRAVVS